MIKLSVKNSKSMNGRDGIAWSCDLYIDGVKAAYVYDGGFGGMVDFDWYNRDLEKKFNAYVDALPLDMSDPDIFPEGMKTDGGTLVAGLCDELEMEKKLKRLCKTKTVVRMKDDGENFSTFKVLFSADVKAKILQKHGDNVVEFVNERFL